MSTGQARPFIGRNQEVDLLNRELDRSRPSLMVLYGRRRVGKSALLAQVTRSRRTIYYQATEVLGSINLALIKHEIARQLGEADPILEALEQWEGLLTYVADAARAGGEPLTLVLDEFPYLCQTVEGLPSIVQKVFDRVTDQRVPLNLILCGSRISFMEELLGERNPLRGRQTLELDLLPMPYREAAAFFPDWAPEDRLAAYGVFGGLPYYLQLCDPRRSLRRNILDVVLDPGGPLSNEADNVLRAELSTPARYATILQAIATGCTTTGQILGRAREISDARALSPYIEKLQALRLVRSMRSMDAPPKARSQRFSLADPFLAFWYRFRLPSSSALAVGHAAHVYDHVIEPELDAYLGEVLEWIGREYIQRYGTEILTSPAREVGKIWGEDYDLDMAGTLLDGSVVFGECKWSRRKVGMSVLRDLTTRTAKTTYGRGAADTHLILLSRSGFTQELQRRAAETLSLHLLDPKGLLGEG
jgi:uncharacterized protein